MAHPLIRVAAADDVDAVLELWRRADTAPSATDDPESVERVVASGQVLVAEADGQIVGTLIATFDGWRGNMYRLAVDPRHRREGVARALVARGEQLLVERGARRISALVLSGEDHATEFWSAAGYELQTGIARYVKTVR